MKTSISRAAPSRSKRTVEAERGAAISAMQLTCCAELGLEIGALVDPRHARQQIVDFGLRGRRDHRARLALHTGRDDAALLEDIFAHGEAGARLLLVADQG